MIHKSNPKFLPPKKSADEYEREIAALQARVEGLETALIKIALSAPLYYDPQKPGLEPEEWICYNADIARAALSPTEKKDD